MRKYKNTLPKIIQIVNSCKTYEQVRSCLLFLDRIPQSDVLYLQSFLESKAISIYKDRINSIK